MSDFTRKQMWLLRNFQLQQAALYSYGIDCSLNRNIHSGVNDGNPGINRVLPAYVILSLLIKKVTQNV